MFAELNDYKVFFYEITLLKLVHLETKHDENTYVKWCLIRLLFQIACKLSVKLFFL